MEGLLGLVSQILGVGGFLGSLVGAYVLVRKLGNENRKTGAEAVKTGAEAVKVGAETEVAVGGLHLQLSESAVKRMKDAEDSATLAKARADAAEETARECRAEADQIRRDRDNDHELIQDLRRDFSRLHGLILGCPTGSVCPVVTELHRFPDLLSGHDPGGTAA